MKSKIELRLPLQPHSPVSHLDRLTMAPTHTLLLPPASPAQDSFVQLFLDSPSNSALRQQDSTTDSITMDDEDSGGLTRMLAAGNASLDDFLLNESILGHSFGAGLDLDRTRIDNALKNSQAKGETLSVEIQRATSGSTISNISTTAPPPSRSLAQLDTTTTKPDKPIRSVPLPVKSISKFNQHPIASTSSLPVPSILARSHSNTARSAPVLPSVSQPVISLVSSTSLPSTITTAIARPKYVVEMRSDDMFARRQRDSGNRGQESSFESSADSILPGRKLNIFTSTPARPSYAPESPKKANSEQKAMVKSESRLSVCFDPPTRAFENDFSLGDVDAIERDGRMMEDSLEENTMEVVEEVTFVEPVLTAVSRGRGANKLEVNGGAGGVKRRASRAFIEPAQKLSKLSTSQPSRIEEVDAPIRRSTTLHVPPLQPESLSVDRSKSNPIRRPSRAFASSRTLPDLPSSSPHAVNRYLPVPRSNAVASSSTAKHSASVPQRRLDDNAIQAAARSVKKPLPRPVAPARIVKPVPTSTGGASISRATLSSSLAQRVKVVVAPLKSSLKMSLATTDGGISGGGKPKRGGLTLPRGFEFSEGTGAGEMRRKREADREREKEDREREEEDRERADMMKRAKSTQRIPRSRPSTSIARTLSQGLVSSQTTKNILQRPEMERSLSIPLTEEALQQKEFDVSNLGMFSNQLAMQLVEEERKAHLQRRVTCFIAGIVEEEDGSETGVEGKELRATKAEERYAEEWNDPRSVLGVAKSSNVVVSPKSLFTRCSRSSLMMTCSTVPRGHRWRI